MTLLQKLSQWQKHTAARTGVEGYRVAPFKTLQAIAQEQPKNEAELLAVKGMGAVKVRQYGTEILALVAGQEIVAQAKTKQIEKTFDLDTKSAFDESAHVQSMLDGQKDEGGNKEHNNAREYKNIDQSTGEILDGKSDDALSVGAFLDALNIVMQESFGNVRIKGEVIGFNHHNSGHAYFSLKDSEDGSVLRCAVFRGSYEMSGVTLEDGMEVIVTGAPSHHKQYGFSFIGSSVELFGEGALKKAYDALKKKFQEEGLFAPERKRSVPELPQKIGLITSRDGAAIGDFTTNVGAFGYQIKFHHTSVEGAKAVKEILTAIKTMSAQDLDVLVIVRGGGSLESLQAFNNENVVRAIADFPVPVIAGIGHEQDETLVPLVADHEASTPTAAARAVRESWDREVGKVAEYERRIIGDYEQVLTEAIRTVDRSEEIALSFFDRVKEQVKDVIRAFMDHTENLTRLVATTKEQLSFYEKALAQNNPERQLALGYSIARGKNGKIVRSTKDVKAKDDVTISVRDGTIETTVK